MRHAFALTVIAALLATASLSPAEAQSRRRLVVQDDNVFILRVQPRSYLDPGTMVQPGSLDRVTSGFAQTQSYLLSPPYNNQEQFGSSVLPDPVTGPFIGARNPFGPVDYGAPLGGY